METTRKLWGHLGVVDTIYEEDDTEDSADDQDSTASLSPVLSPSPASLRSRSVLSPCMPVTLGDENNVVIHVGDSSFRVKKGPLIANSSYFKRLIKHHPSKELTISPPLNITPETFSLVIEYCTGSHILITPFNVAPLRVAADMFEMTEVNGDDLRQRTETYLRRVVAVNKEYTGIVLRSCVPMILEAETTACLVSRCIEALSLLEEEEEGVLGCLEDLANFPTDGFQVVVESLNHRLSNHDILYRLVDFYFKAHVGEITDEEKVKMCNYIDCTILSPQLVMHAVQNPRMPLRFVVQAMFLEQLNTRRTIFSAADQHHDLKQLTTHKQTVDNPKTLGAILERDAALRQVAQLKANMDTTRYKVQSLEKELVDMRRLLQESESTRKIAQDSCRSQSFRTVSSTQMNKIERDQIGSVSSVSFRVLPSKERGVVSKSWSPPLEEEELCRISTKARADQKNLGRRLMNGIKNAFRVSNSVSKKTKGETKNSCSKNPGDGERDGTNEKGCSISSISLNQ